MIKRGLGRADVNVTDLKIGHYNGVARLVEAAEASQGRYVEILRLPLSGSLRMTILAVW